MLPITSIATITISTMLTIVSSSSIMSTPIRSALDAIPRAFLSPIVTGITYAALNSVVRFYIDVPTN